MSLRHLLLALALLPAALHAQERYGFVAKLGRDTISVERVARSGDGVVSDEIERFPRVTARHTELLLATDGAVRHFSMRITLPTAVTPKWHERTFAVDYLPDSLRVTITNAEGTRSITFPSHGEAWMPWVAQDYLLTELYVAAAVRRGGDSIQMRQYYPDVQIDQMPDMIRINPGGLVRTMPGNRAEIYRHDGLAGIGEAVLDARRRMVSYSGARTTYKMEVVRVTSRPDIEAITRDWTETEKVQGVASDLSVRDTARGRVGSAELLVDYGRPLARGRELVGNVMPYDAVWRTGANAATQFTTTAPITMAGLDLAPGTYTLWTLPTRDSIMLIVNRQSRQWGTQYDASRDLGRARYAVSATAAPVERFTISFGQDDATHGRMVLEWGPFKWTAPIVVKE